MSIEPTITIDVDLRNPGQFFACCGLLELANRVSPSDNRARGWFCNIEKPIAKFQIEAVDAEGNPLELPSLLDALKNASIVSDNENSKEGPLTIGEPFFIEIDWRKAFPQNSLVKTWAGQQNVFEIIKALQGAIPEKVSNGILSVCREVKSATTAFNTSLAEDVIDAGFSLDKLSDRLKRHPAIFVELLSLIGLQHFCPARGERRLTRIYYAWKEPLPVLLASIAICYSLPGIKTHGFSFDMYKRDSEGRYKAFAPAKPIILKEGE